MEGERLLLKCPECGSERIWKDGLRSTRNGDVQRWLCRSCGYRFSDPEVKIHVTTQRLKMPNSGKNHVQTSVFKSDSSLKKTPEKSSLFIGKDVRPHFSSPQGSATEGLNSLRFYNSKHQVCVNEEKMKNLVKVETRTEKRAAGATINSNQAEIKGKIVDFAWWMKKGGYAETTIVLYTTLIKILIQRGANIHDLESVKEVIAKQQWSDSTRNNAIAAYTLLLKMTGRTWQPPICHVTRKLPFIPTELELDQMIAGCGKKTAIFLQTLKETAMRSGEANNLRWIDIDNAKRTITLNHPEKNSNSRIFRVSSKLIDMLNGLPKPGQRVFGDSPTRFKKSSFYRSRKLIAKKLQNPRILRIHFHTFRHWKATKLYHQTKDVLYVKEFLGHKRIENTLLYIQLANALFKEMPEEFTTRVAKNVKGARALIEAGFEKVDNFDGVHIYRKRK